MKLSIKHRGPWLASIILLTPLLATAATITTTIDAVAIDHWNLDGSPEKGSETFSGYGAWTRTDFLSSAQGQAAAYAEANSGIGFLKLAVGGEETAPDHYTAGSGAHARIQYWDSFQLNSATLAIGTQVLMTLSLYVPGHTSIAGAANSLVGGYVEGVAEFSVNAALNGNWEATAVDSKNLHYGTSNNTFPASHYFSLSKWVSIGDVTHLYLDLLAVGYSNAGAGSSNWSVDYGHSLYFAGIDALKLADGTKITDFTALGEGGMDYKKSYVPTSTVPDCAGTLGLLTVASLALVGARRRVV